MLWKLQRNKADEPYNKDIGKNNSSSSFEGHPLQARHKQDWGQGFILLLPQTAALPGSDAGSDVIKPASKFPRSQYRPSLITPPRFAMAVPSMPVKRWNFRKAKWSHYIALTNKFAKTLLPPDSLNVDAAYQDFCNTIKKAAKKTIPRGYRNNYIPCWDAECESLYKIFLQSPQGDDSSLAATALLAKLDRKRRDRWSEAVRSTARTLMSKNLIIVLKTFILLLLS